jgi:hypothetical protein
MLIAGLSFVIFFRSGQEGGDAALAAKSDNGRQSLGGKPSKTNAAPGMSESTPPGDGSASLARRLDALIEALRNGLPRDEAMRLLAELKRLVHALPPDQAAAALIAFLESGEDQPTGLGFEIGGEGVMQQTPTIRTAVIDLLGQTDPYKAAEYSRSMLGSTSSSDEYALALRNLGWAYPAVVPRQELADAFQRMLAREEWSAQPSRGFLEAFDIAVVAGAVGQVTPLLQDQPVGTPEPPLSRAAFVALDRMMLREPEALIKHMEGNPSALTKAPFHRASLMARLDPRAGGQIKALENYILRADHAPGEMEYFSEIFPNPNRFHSQRLVTSHEEKGSMEDQDVLDRATLEVLDRWLTEARFAEKKPVILAIRERLATFLPTTP